MDSEKRLSRRRFLKDVAKAGLGVAAGAVALDVLAACAPAASPTPAPTTAPGATAAPTAAPTVIPTAKTALKVRMAIVPGSQTLWRYLAAKNEELFKPLGYDVEFRNMTDEAAQRTAFLTGDIDVMTANVPVVPSLKEQAGPVQFFLPFAWAQEGYLWFVKKDSPIQTVADMKGKKVACFDLNHPGQAYWRALLLENYGLRLEKDFDLIISNNPGQAVDVGQAEVGITASWDWAKRKETGNYRAISTVADEWKKVVKDDVQIILGGALAKTEWIQKNKKFVDDYIKIAYEALKVYKTNKEAFMKVVVEYTGNGTAPKYAPGQAEFIAWYLGMDANPPERIYLSQRDVEDHKKLFPMLFRCGYLKSEPSPQDVEAMFYMSKPQA